MNSLCIKTISFFPMISSHPLFSCIVTFYTLILLYLPCQFVNIVLSPVLILTGILFLTILRFGSIQKSQHEQKENQEKHENRAKYREEKEKRSSTCSVELKDNSYKSSEIEEKSEMGLESSSSFVEWNVRAPLEVIYEEFEDEEKWDDSNERKENKNMGILNFPLLSRYYPESDSDSSSERGFPAREDWDSSDDWDEEDREGLIEIALDSNKMMMVMKREIEFQCEEENLIEIDISPMRYKEFSGHRDSLNGGISCN